MRCSVCGHESPAGSSFCLNCGSALTQTPVAAAGLPAQSIICSSCRGENPPGMKFCRSCGNTLQQTAPAYGAPGMGAGYSPSTIPQNFGGPAPAPQPIGTGPTAPGQGFPQGMPQSGPLPTPPPAARPQGPAAVAAGMAARAPQPGPQGSTITCPRCGTATPVGFAYCQQCGLHIQPIAPTDPGAGQQPQRSRQPSQPQPPAAIPTNGVDPHGGTIAQPDSVRPSGPINPPPQAAPVAVRMKEPSTRTGTGAAWGTAVLVNRDGSDGQRFSLTSDDTVIGRAGADIAFDDDRFLAKQHARFERDASGSVKIHALDALNGVFKKADGPVELADGISILVGREVLLFERLSPEEKTVHPLVRHGVALFGSPPREPYARLLQLVPSGGYRDVRHLANEETVLGREEGDIVFRDDAFMSRRHAAITWNGTRAQVTDLGSSNGTFVRIAGPTVLKSGDHVRMGDQLLRIELR
ncbi:MAG: FHA domain-containing protein [Kofleriaceae bacterium]